MTEAEAKTKWCFQVTDCSRCIGSECMAWRWEAGSYYDSGRGFVVADLGKAGVGHAHGFCGLAGKP